MADSILRDKSKAFAKEIVFLCRQLRENNDVVIDLFCPDSEQDLEFYCTGDLVVEHL